MDISVIIIAKNEAENIQKCVTSALQVSNDVIVADTGSTDDTAVLAQQSGARVIQVAWDGYGQTKNNCAAFAVNSWIFSLDADETITPQLAAALTTLATAAEGSLFKIKRVSFFGEKEIKHGSWKKDYVVRLYNKNFTGWNNSDVHEGIIKNNATIITLEGTLHHFTVKSLIMFTRKNIEYAYLWATNAAKKNKRPLFIKQYAAPLLNFIQGYIILLGFLDGIEGYWIARINAFYTFMKYAALREIQKKAL